MSKVKTVQVQNRLIIADGKGPLRYVDLDTNKVHVYKPPRTSIKERILKSFRRQLFENVLFYPQKDGFVTIGTQPQLMNILKTTEPRLRFDGQIRWYEKYDRNQ